MKISLFLLLVFALTSGCETKTKVLERCGDGFLDPGEECDKTELAVGSCTELGYYEQTGTLVCLSDCTLDRSVCVGGRCGDGIIQGIHKEDCDGENLAGSTCMGLGLGSGTLSCNAHCRWDTTGCELTAECGDGTVAYPFEQCEPSDLRGETCVGLGFYDGELGCSEDCRSYDESGCSGRCGDGEIQTVHGENCDGENLAGETCMSLGYSPRGGSLSCNSLCRWDTTDCFDRSSNANLAALSVSEGTLMPSFFSVIKSYSVTVPGTVNTLTVAGTAEDEPFAVVTISPAQPMALVEGENTATVTVTAEDGTQTVYLVNVTRLSPHDHLSPFVGILHHVPAGTFQRDSTATNLSVVSAFFMSKYEITRAQWVAVTGWTDPSDVTYSGGMNHPVQMVSWYDAIAFCNKLSLLEGLEPVYSVSGVDFSSITYSQIPTGNDTNWNAVTANWSANGYRLPTEMEWMWAAMGADTANPGEINTTGYGKAFSGSNGTNLIGDYAVFGYFGSQTGRTMEERTEPVGTRFCNELKIHDLSGNVTEWVWDRSGTHPNGTIENYRGPATGNSRVIVGGNWSSGAAYCAVYFRISGTQYNRDYVWGFRVVRP